MKNNLLIIFTIIIIFFAITSEANLKIRSFSYRVDREFTNLLPYLIGGWDLKYETRDPLPYNQIVPPGAVIHLYVQNESSEPEKIDHVFLNDIDLSKHILPIHKEHMGLHAASYLLNDVTTTPPEVREKLDKLGSPIWYGIQPNPIPAGNSADITIRLRYIPKEKYLYISTENKKSPRTKINTKKPETFEIASVNFNDSINHIYLYLRNNKNFTVDSIIIDNKNKISLENKILKSQNGFLPVEISLKTSWDYGSFHNIRVITNKGQTAETITRARDSFFALGMWGYRRHGNTEEEMAKDTCTTIKNHLFNTHMGMGHNGFLESPKGLGLIKELGMRRMVRDPQKGATGLPHIYARFLLDEPDAHEYSIDDLPANSRLGCYAEGLVERKNHWTSIDPRTLSLLNVDLTYQPHNWLVYGQLPDIFALDPYYINRLKDAYWKRPGQLAQYCHPYYVYALCEVARWACEPNPMHVILNCVSSREKDMVFRYSTPEEKRIEFYYALAAGTKGISYWWFTPYGECYGCGSDEPEAKALMKEMALLNAEGRCLEPLLAESCPAAISDTKVDPFAKTLPYWLMARTLFVGDHTALIILINKNHSSDKDGTMFEPIPKATITFEPPEWLKAASSFRLHDGKIENLEWNEKDNSLSTQIFNINLTEILILTENPDLEKIAKERLGELIEKIN